MVYWGKETDGFLGCRSRTEEERELQKGRIGMSEERVRVDIGQDTLQGALHKQSWAVDERHVRLQKRRVDSAFPLHL